MGLAGRKVKQRIGNDPRNLSWADDAARFGQNYLAKFGWDSSKGLGISGDGRTTHIKVSHKLDLMGIGAAHQKDPNGIAWKQNRDFENLLRRLNDGAGDGGVETSEREEGGDVGLKMGGGWMKAKETSVNVQEDENGEEQEAGSNGNSGKKKKRKRKAEDTEESSSSKSKKKRKKENEEDDDYKSVENKKHKKKKMSTSQDVESNATLEKSGGDPALVKDKPADTPEPTSASGTNTPVIPRHRAYT
ncbi:hypothetical protein BDN72DRAFT_520746 [Pluteus cervinus]|uniref:Uncharacterized protein n=1 Tax=Pluteus cervinus TaxID=181527 RepID=A0ACD3BC28_9AGAR|nr:hypothetical protein BDN72DRAFT_520746 [Pluteus cervinus]